MSSSSNAGTIGFAALCLLSVATARGGYTSSLPALRSAKSASVAIRDDMSMIKPRPMPDKLVKPASPHRARMKSISNEKKEWRDLYIKALQFQLWLDPFCRKCKTNKATEGHHPYGQLGWLIMIFAPVCRACHNLIENNKKQSRQEGWILYQ